MTKTPRQISICRGVCEVGMRNTLLTVLILSGLAGPLQAGDVLSGPVKVINGTSMIVAGKRVQLAHIKSVLPGTKCTWKNRPLDCGVLARAGLQDISVGAKITCWKAKGAPGYICRADGFDLAFGLIHAGWAVPTRTAPEYYFARAARAQKRHLALWGATDADGAIIASKL